MRSLTTEITIDSGPDDVWAVLMDLERYREWNPFIQEAAGTVAVGDTLTLRFVPTSGRPMTIRPKVLVAIPGKELRWKGKLGGLPGVFDGEHRFELRSTETGATKLVHSEQFSGILVPVLGKLIARAKDSFVALNQALKDRVESGDG